MLDKYQFGIILSGMLASVLVDGLASGSRSGSWHQSKVKVKVRGATL